MVYKRDRGGLDYSSYGRLLHERDANDGYRRYITYGVVDGILSPAWRIRWTGTHKMNCNSSMWLGA